MRSAIAIAMILLAAPRAAAGQAPASGGGRLQIDANLFASARPIEGERSFTHFFVMAGEVGTAKAIYPGPSRTHRVPVDAGASFWIWPEFGVGASVAGFRHEGSATLTAAVPHPSYLASFGTATGATGVTLGRREWMTNVSVMVRSDRNGKAQLRVYGGPTLFIFRADMVNEILFTQTASPATPGNVVVIDGFSSEEAKGTGLGFHIGVDLAYFPIHWVGLTGGLRFSRGTVTVDAEPLSRVEQQFRAGGTQLVLGVRFNLGR